MKNRLGKTMIVAGICLAMSVPFVGCGRGTAADSKTVSIDVVEVADKIVKEGSFKDEMNKIDDDQFEAAYDGVEEGLIKNKCVYNGTGATAEQVVVLEARDASSAEKLKEQLNTKLEGDIEENKDYNPEEVAKLQAPVLEVENQYAIMVVSKDNSKVEEIVKREIK